jgi:hypothetical protein
MVLKVHKQLTAINQELLSNPSIYAKINNCQDLRDCTDVPFDWTPNNALFANMEEATRNNYVSGDSKYISLLADYMNALNVDNITPGSSRGSFTTLDGINWVVDGFDITIDIDNNANGGCIHSLSCSNPDRFQYNSSPTTGLVSGVDPLTRAYLANPHKLNDRKNDYKKSLETNNELVN